MSLTTDRNHPDLGHGTDKEPVEQSKVYLVLSDEEKAKGFVRPVREVYVHAGLEGPKTPLRPLNEKELELWGDEGYAGFEEYPEDHPGTATGRFWTQKELDNKGCGQETRMGRSIAETYAREPRFYGSTYCTTCSKHLPVKEFRWLDGSIVGS